MTRPTLIEFLTARLDEDEAVAERLRSSSAGDPWGWQPNRLETCEKRRVDYPPARVLADVKAKRAIVALSQTIIDSDPYEIDSDAPTAAGMILRNLASVYADHADFREEWRV
jgi:hypothetical protein